MHETPGGAGSGGSSHKSQPGAGRAPGSEASPPLELPREGREWISQMLPIASRGLGTKRVRGKDNI